MKKVLGVLSLFGSFGTLFCCALPVLLVSVGMGATFASISSTIPQVHFFTANKGLLFLVTGTLLLFSYFMMRQSEVQACPIDKTEDCGRGKMFSKWAFRVSVIFYFIGLIFSYVIPKVMYAID